MKLTKYLSTNILFLLGVLLFILFILLEITGAHYNGQNLYIDSLFEHYYIYIPSILCLLVFIPIEMLFHKITHNKFLLNISFKNEEIRYTYNILFWFGIISSIFYFLVFIWGITRITN